MEGRVREKARSEEARREEMSRKEETTMDRKNGEEITRRKDPHPPRKEKN